MCRCTPEIRTPFCGKPGCDDWNDKPIGARTVTEELLKDIEASGVHELAGCIPLLIAEIRRLREALTSIAAKHCDLKTCGRELLEDCIETDTKIARQALGIEK